MPIAFLQPFFLCCNTSIRLFVYINEQTKIHCILASLVCSCVHCFCSLIIALCSFGFSCSLTLHCRRSLRYCDLLSETINPKSSCNRLFFFLFGCLMLMSVIHGIDHDHEAYNFRIICFCCCCCDVVVIVVLISIFCNRFWLNLLLLLFSTTRTLLDISSLAIFSLVVNELHSLFFS